MGWPGVTCNDVSQSFGEADVKVMLPAAEPWDELRNEVDRDPYMAIGAAQRCIRAHKAGLPFTLVRPGNSIARELNCWKELEAMEGVFIVEHHRCMFQPCLNRSSKSFSPFLKLLRISRQGLQRRRVCSRTKSPHSVFAHEVKDDRVLNFGLRALLSTPNFVKFKEKLWWMK